MKMMARHWLFRVSVAVNLIVLVYLALYSTSSNYPTSTSTSDANTNVVATSSSSSGSGGSSSNNNNNEANNLLQSPQSSSLVGTRENFPQSYSNAKSSSVSSGNSNDKLEALDDNGVPVPVVESMPPSQSQQVVISDDAAEADSNDNFMTNANNNNNNNPSSNAVSADDLMIKRDEENEQSSTNNKEMLNDSSNAIVVEKVIKMDRDRIFPCDDLSPRSYFGQRGPFWVLYNYVTPTRKFTCDESITYTTHADFTFLDNLVPLLDRWQGPVSLSLYSPGTDFDETIERIHYLRECSSPLVKELVSFHLFFDHKHIPKNLTKLQSKKPPKPLQAPAVNCSAELKFGEGMTTFKKQKKLPYPVNVARNVAREMAPTHYVLASDIELYPNPNLIPNFIDMVKRNDSKLRRPNPKLFVLPIFEVEANVTSLPYDKSELQDMLKQNVAIPFHKYVCAGCHRIPKQEEWQKAAMKPGLNVFHIGKRQKPYHHWEPIYIGTKLDPMYDERLTWEGRSDKMTQGYVLCVLDYEFHILDNAFLVHRPGIKRTVVIPSKNPVVAKQNHVIRKFILPELILLYGRRAGCVV